MLSAEPGGTIVIGQRARTREEFAQMVEEGRWGELLNEIPVHAGDFFQIDAGTVHAIKGGTVILETQQSSDITYRVYDYDRTQADDSLRELHLAQALDVIDYDRPLPSSGEVAAADGPICTLEANDRYTVERVDVSGTLTVPLGHPFTCVSVIAGEGDPLRRAGALRVQPPCLGRPSRARACGRDAVRHFLPVASIAEGALGCACAVKPAPTAQTRLSKRARPPRAALALPDATVRLGRRAPSAALKCADGYFLFPSANLCFTPQLRRGSLLR